MAEEKSKKIEAGRSLFNNYQKKKNLDSHGRSGELYYDTVEELCGVSHCVTTSPGSAHLSEFEGNKMDSPSLQKKAAHFSSQSETIKCLQDRLSEKNEIINALEIQIKVLRNGTGDHVAIDSTDKRMVHELKTMVEARDTYISQLSDSLQQRSEELKVSLNSEKQLTEEVKSLRQEIKAKSKETEIKQVDTYRELVEYKAKVEVLSCKNQDLIQSLEFGNKNIRSLQEELAAVTKNVEKEKLEAAEDIKKLMRQVEELNQDLSKSKKELMISQRELEALRGQQEEQLGEKIMALKAEFNVKFNNDIKKIEKLYDGMLLEQIRNSEMELKSIDKTGELEAQISSCKMAYDKEIETYKTDLEKLVNKSRTTEEELLQQLNEHKQEAEHYKQQVENLENKVSEEIQKIQHECHRELNNYEAEQKEREQQYEEEIKNLSTKLKDYAVKEAQREVEIEVYKHELGKNGETIDNLIEKLDSYKASNDKQKVHSSQVQQEMERLKETMEKLEMSIRENKKREERLKQELRMSNEELNDYKQQARELNELLESASAQSTANYIAAVKAFEGQTQELMSELEKNKTIYEEDIQQWRSQVNELQMRIHNLEARLRLSDETGESSGMNRTGNDTRTNNTFLINMLRGMRDVKQQIQALIQSTQEDVTENKQQLLLVGNGETVDHEGLSKELEKTMGDILYMTQSMNQINSGESHSGDTNYSTAAEMVTSTPNVKQLHNHCWNYRNTNDWMQRCTRLEDENRMLTKNLELLTTNMKEMEFCLVIASQETSSFNRKCQILHDKMTELENSKLSEHLLKKENNELKERLRLTEETERRLQSDLDILQQNNIRLEQMVVMGIVELQKELAQRDTSPNNKVETVINELKNKSEEVIRLKSQLASLQKLEQEQRSKITELQTKYKHFIAKHEFLANELISKKKELEEIWKERYKLSTDVKLLQTRLCMFDSQVSNNNSLNSVESCTADSDDRTAACRLQTTPHRWDGSDDVVKDAAAATALALDSRRQTTQSRLDGGDDVVETMSVVDRIAKQLQLLDQEMDALASHMPTIAEEEEDGPYVPTPTQSPDYHQWMGGKNNLHHRCWAALRQLLGMLFDEYATCVKRLAWKEELVTLDFNLHKELDASFTIARAKTYVTQSSSLESEDLMKTKLSNLHSPESLRKITEACLTSLFFLRKRVITSHNAVLKTINVQKEQLEKANILAELQKEIDSLKKEKTQLEKNHKSAIELLIKDHDTELGVVNSLLANLQETEPVTVVTEDAKAMRKSLENKHQREMEELRTYFEKKCADLEKNYSEEVNSQSQQSCRVSVSSSSEDMAELYLCSEQPPTTTDQPCNEENSSDRRVKELLDSMQEKYKIDLESVKSECELRLSESLCRACKRNNLLESDEEPGNKDLELKIYQIKEEVRRDYEQELDKIREEIVAKELKRKDEEINTIRTQLNEAHKMEVEKMWHRYEDLANKEVENSMIRVKNEVVLSQELEEKARVVKQLKEEKRELIVRQKKMTEQHQKELDKMNRSHRRETDNMKQAFHIELTTRLDTAMEERAEMEDRLKRQLEDLRQSQEQGSEKQDIQELSEMIRKDILLSLELQIKSMVEAGDGGDKSEWPPELSALEQQLTARYQEQLALLVREHALETASLRAHYEARLNRTTMKKGEDMCLAVIATGDEDVDKIIRERDSLRNLALTLRQVVRELAGYLGSCEDELNRSIVGHLVHLANTTSSFSPSRLSIVEEKEESDSDSLECGRTPKKVHFAPDVSSIVSLMDEDALLNCLETSASASIVDVSVHFRSELEACLLRLRAEAATVLGLTQIREQALPSTVEDRRLSSLTRQLIEEKKCREEAELQLQQLRQLLVDSEQELNDVRGDLMETKELMMKEKIAEFNEAQAEKTAPKLCFLQEKARGLLGERGDCPPEWLSVIEELCAAGDSVVDEAWRTRDELQLEVEAADKQLRSTRAFLEEQAAEREQERDEFTRELTRLRELLRDRDRDRSNHEQCAAEQLPPPTALSSAHTPDLAASGQRTVDNLEKQVQETTEVLKESEGKRERTEQELKAAVDKIWVLRDIISELEVQVSVRAEREDELERRVAQLSSELEAAAHDRAHSQCSDAAGTGDAQAAAPTKQNTAAVTQIKRQVKSLARSLEKPIKELEAVNIHVSSASLSSPSEDVSVREQLEALRSSTPESHSSPPSPVHVEELSLLSDKLTRYSRAAETVIKTLRDRDMEIVMLKRQSEELQAERDVVQAQTERQLLQMAALRNRVEELRVRNEREAQVATAPLHQHILQLERQVSNLTDQQADTHRQLMKAKQKLERSESLLASQEAELSSLSQSQHELADKLRQDLATMNAEKQQLQAMVEKYRMEDNVSFPQLVEVMLADKNADIDQLQQRVEQLQQQQEQMAFKSQIHSSKSRGHRVSFADDMVHSQLSEGEKAREVQYTVEASSIKPYFSTPFSSIEAGGNRFEPRMIGEDISKIPEPPEMSMTSTPSRAVQLESVLGQLKGELELKNQRLAECKARLGELPCMQQELTRAQQELSETVAAVQEDKRFYEEKLKTLADTQQLLAERESELSSVQIELCERERDIVRMTADVRALQAIMEGLQTKLQEAKNFAESNSDSNKYREQLNNIQTELDGERAGRRTLQETVDMLQREKEEIREELTTMTARCEALQNDLDRALNHNRARSEKTNALLADVEAITKENKQLNANCQRLKKEMDQMTKKQKVELKNILTKDTEEASKMKEELKCLKSSNSELQLECEKLKHELREMGDNLDLLRELNNKDDKIQQLESELKQLDENNRLMKYEKSKTEQSLNMEISEMKVLIDDLNKNIASLETESKDCQDNVTDKEQKEELYRKYVVLKRDYDRQRRARRESEKKCIALRDELTKEKQFTAQLQRGGGERQTPQLRITRANLVDIRPDQVKPASSLDDLTDEVQKQLDTSAKLDQTLISGLQSAAESGEGGEECDGGRSECMPQRVQYLTAKLASAETALHVEQVVLSELRARLVEERTRYLEQRTRAHQLSDELAALHAVNDQMQDKFNDIADQLEQQVSEIKQLRENEQPSQPPGVNSTEKELRRLLEENKRRVQELLQERVFNRNQLLYLHEELARVTAERNCGREVQTQSQGADEESLQQVLEREQNKNAALQQLLDRETDRLRQGNDNKQKLEFETQLRKSLEAKIKTIERAERSRYSRRKAAEEKLREQLAAAHKSKRELEQECHGLQLKLAQAQLQLTAHTAESPLSLRLTEAIMAVERLVGEKEDLSSAVATLREERAQLLSRANELQDTISDLHNRIRALNIKVTDNATDSLTAVLMAEREAWQREREALRRALAERPTTLSSDPINGYTNSAHILQRFLRAENHRNALVWQKRYLLVALRGYQEQEARAIQVLGQQHPVSERVPVTMHTPAHRFRVAVCAVRSVSRLQFLVQHRRRSHLNTCRVLQHALSRNRGDSLKIPDVQTLWSNAAGISSGSSLQPGTLSQYLDQFHAQQDHLRQTLSTES